MFMMFTRAGLTIAVALVTIASCAGGGIQAKGAGAVTGTPSPRTTGAFRERSGVVSIEVEHALEAHGWIPVPGKSGEARQDATGRGGNGHLTFDIDFDQAGRYYAFLLSRHNHAAEQDDCFLTLDGQKLFARDGTTRPDGMQASSFDFTWSMRPKGPGGHTPEHIKEGPVYFEVPGPGRRRLVIGSRSVKFEVDKIVLKKDDATPPSGSGPPETLPAL